MYCSLGDDVGVQAVAKVDRVDVVAALDREMMLAGSTMDLKQAKPFRLQGGVSHTIPDRCT